MKDPYPLDDHVIDASRIIGITHIYTEYMPTIDKLGDPEHAETYFDILLEGPHKLRVHRFTAANKTELQGALAKLNVHRTELIDHILVEHGT